MAYIYIGETIKKENLLKNRVYKSKPEDLIAKLKAQGISLGAFLFVEIGKIAEEKAKMNQPGTPIYEAKKQIINVLKRKEV